MTRVYTKSLAVADRKLFNLASQARDRVSHEFERYYVIPLTLTASKAVT